MDNSLKIHTVFAFMTCDGEIAPEELELMYRLCGDAVDEDKIKAMLANLNRYGKSYILGLLDKVKDANPDKDESLQLMRVAVDTILADNKLEYNEIKFLKLFRACLPSISDAEILASDPRIEDYWLERDLASPDLAEVNFATVTLPASFSLSKTR